MANVKCKKCGKSIDKKQSVKEEYITSTLKIANRYFCSEKCRREFNFEVQIKDEFYSKCSELIGIDLTKNSYFKKKLSEIGYENQSRLYVCRHFEELSSEFKNNINKIEKQKQININYKIAVLTNMIANGIKIYFNEEILENYNTEGVIIEDYIDYENLMPKGKQVKERKTIFDLED